MHRTSPITSDLHDGKQIYFTSMHNTTPGSLQINNDVVFPFNFVIPTNLYLPPSFRYDAHNYIEYAVTATMMVKSTIYSNPTMKTLFFLYPIPSPQDVNPVKMNPIQIENRGEVSKAFAPCCCCIGGQVLGTVELIVNLCNRQVYSPGESVHVTVLIKSNWVDLKSHINSLKCLIIKKWSKNSSDGFHERNQSNIASGTFQKIVIGEMMSTNLFLPVDCIMSFNPVQNDYQINLHPLTWYYELHVQLDINVPYTIGGSFVFRVPGITTTSVVDHLPSPAVVPMGSIVSIITTSPAIQRSVNTMESTAVEPLMVTSSVDM
jgi:hypothetical protein